MDTYYSVHFDKITNISITERKTELNITFTLHYFGIPRDVPQTAHLLDYFLIKVKNFNTMPICKK